MHLYTISRGARDKIDTFFRDLEAQYLPYKTGTTPLDNKFIQFGVRPIYLHELTFPKEQLDVVLRTIQPATFKGENKLSKIRLVMDKLCWILRRILKLKDIPEYKLVDKDNKPLPRLIMANRELIDIRGIGLKDDKKAEIELI